MAPAATRNQNNVEQKANQRRHLHQFRSGRVSIADAKDRKATPDKG
jgi:hypothetical protein